MIEVYNVWMTLPWNVQLACVLLLTTLSLLWLLSPKRTHPWSYQWERRIDHEVAETRKLYKGKARRRELENTFAHLVAALELETGGCNFILMPNAEHRMVWMYLYRKIHYTL